jgi:antitoxin FitA
MAQLLVRKVNEKVVRELKARAGRNGVSTEEEHRRILQEALLGPKRRKKSFKEHLLSFPNVGKDSDFERPRLPERPVEL